MSAELKGFAEAAGINVPSELGMPTFGENRDGEQRYIMEMRNRPWHQAIDYLRRHRKISGYQFIGDVWTPRDLKRGDIVRVNLPTDFERNGDMKLTPRNVLVLGVDVDPETLEPIAIRTTRFSFNTANHNDQYEPYFDSSDTEWNKGTLGGLEKPAVLRTGSAIDVIPFSSVYWGHFMDVKAHVKPDFMADVIEDAMAEGYEHSRKHRGLRNYAEMPTGEADTLFLPSANPQHIVDDYDFQLDEEIGTDIFDLQPEEIDMIMDELEAKHLQRNADRRLQFEAEDAIMKAFGEKRKEEDAAISAMMAEYRRRQKETEVSIADAIAGLKRDSNMITDEDIPDILRIAQRRMDEADEAIVSEVEEGDDFAKAQRQRLADIPPMAELLKQAAEQWAEENDPNERARRAIEDQQFNDATLERLKDLGIGGLSWNDVNLPPLLWKGAYVMAKIPTIVNHERGWDQIEQNRDFTNRPCIVNRAWAKVDKDTGLPKLAALELHPVTRSAAHHFKYKMNVRPLDTKSTRKSFLIAEQVERVPVDITHFPRDYTLPQTFYQMTPDQLAKFEEKKQHAADANGEIKVFGIQDEDIPEDWFEIELPDAPDHKFREKLKRWDTNVRFNGSNGRLNKTGGSRQPKTRGLGRRAHGSSHGKQNVSLAGNPLSGNPLTRDR